LDLVASARHDSQIIGIFATRLKFFNPFPEKTQTTHRTKPHPDMKTSSPIKRCWRPGQSFFCALWLLAILFCIQSAQALNFTLPLYEPFAYTNNEPLGAGGPLGSSNTWTWGNSASGSSAHPNTNASLSYIGMPADTIIFATNSGPCGLIANTGTGKVRGGNFNNPVTNVTIYSSFLLNIRSLSVAVSDRLLFGLGAATGGSGADGGAAVWLDPSGRLKISKNSTATAATSTTYPLVISNTYLVVFRYQVNPTNIMPDQVDLWLNPGALGEDSNIPTPDLTTTNNANARTFNSMTFNGNAPTHVFYMDEIRVATNWSNVTTPTSWAGNTYNVTGGGSGCAGDSFVIGLSSSDSGISYLVYTNGVLSDISATGTGSPISFGAQTTTATYTVLATNTTDTTVHWMKGNAVVSVLTPPTITSQPAPVLAATNSSVVFIVSVTGSSPQYQWFRNGVGLANGANISGVTAPVLIISPVTSAEVATANAGYYCIITNACGYTTNSITNSLTLHAADTIVWQGAPTNLWDISTMTNWTNSAGAAVVFNQGDNVILDDTFRSPVLALQSQYLSPGLISFVGSQIMAISGNGNLNGNGSIFGLNSSLLINGTGTLSVSNANDFAGGTVISNGTLAIYTYTRPIGSGAITLAGGTFRAVPSSQATQFSNNIVVVTDSTLEYDGTGGNGFNYAGTLTGSAGKTLTIFNNSIASTFNWLRLLKGFTNDANIVLTSPAASVDLTPVLTGGDQIFNGVISGTVGRIRVTGANNSVILNAQNTFNDSASVNNTTMSLYMNGGNVGFGADSVSSSPPTIDSSPAGTGNIGIGVAAGEGANCGFFASGGAHTVGNPIIYPSATNTFIVSIIGNNNLTLSGSITLSGADGTGNTNRTFSVTNTALTTFSGVISDGGLGCGLIKTGNGILDLNGANTYAGPTVVSNGILAGIGSIVSPVTIAPAGSIGAGTVSIGTLTVNNNLTLNGNGFFKLNKSVSPSNDMVSVSGTLANTGTGTITVTNIGVTAVTNGDTFHLFNKAVTGANTLTIAGAGMVWTNNLSVDGSIRALVPVPPIANYSTNISFTLTGGSLTINWPATHLGWILQVQTNASSVGLNLATNTWHDVPNSASVNSTNYQVNPANPTVFYRLRHP